MGTPLISKRGGKGVSTLILRADAFQIPLASDSIQATVSSPPYYRLRKYAGHSENAFGWEKTVSQYVRRSVLALREIRRVLRSDGVVFWIVSDSYYGSNRGRGSRISKLNPFCEPSPLLGEGVAKSLCLIPERLAIAAQDDGWIIRDIIIWHKKNGLPESVKDRCTRNYEQILMLVRQKNYFWNTAEAVEPSRTSPHAVSAGPKGDKLIALGLHGKRTDSPISARHQLLAGRKVVGNRIPRKDTRTMRDVWTIPTYAHKDDHVAIFPEALAERCIRIGSKPGDTILDCFAGSGTTGLVAEQLGRNSILLDISEEYTQLMKRRIAKEDAFSADDERCEG
jgi:DNA modification methylase